MSDQPLIVLSNPARIEDEADAFQCVVGGREATYLSVPITTGRRFIEWFALRGRELDPGSEAYKREHEAAVIRPNCEAAKQLLASLRAACQHGEVVIEPTALVRPHWGQDEYRYFWGKVIERYVGAVVFLAGWEYSSGCAFEFLTATRAGAETRAANGRRIARPDALAWVRRALDEMQSFGVKAEFLATVAGELDADARRAAEVGSEVAEPAAVRTAVTTTAAAAVGGGGGPLKDQVLGDVARAGNVAQFVSFDRDATLTERFSRVIGYPPDYRFANAHDAVRNLLIRSPDGTVNVRSFDPSRPKGEPLVYGLRHVEDVIGTLREKSAAGKYTIVNETIDIHDGGVSGVAMGDVIEFAPGDSPKCVDKPGICSLPRAMGIRILSAVYGFRPALEYPADVRVEFSIHPRRRGLRNEHTIIWELEEVGAGGVGAVAQMAWPNRFSRQLGDKAFGLLVADSLDLPVPRATVIPRALAPFTLGRATGSSEVWMRTCPRERSPGKYLTTRGWVDPFQLLAKEDAELAAEPGRVPVVSVLAQSHVEAQYSGAAIPGQAGGPPLIEGVRGLGDRYMLGEEGPQPLPPQVYSDVIDVYTRAAARLGPVEIEWAYDGRATWILQLHRSHQASAAGPVTFDRASQVHRFDVSLGLEELRSLLGRLKGTGAGVVVVGDVGVASHFGDLLRSSGLPWRIEGLRSASNPAGMERVTSVARR
jgi:hypothetical protein